VIWGWSSDGTQLVWTLPGCPTRMPCEVETAVGKRISMFLNSNSRFSLNADRSISARQVRPQFIFRVSAMSAQTSSEVRLPRLYALVRAGPY